MNIYEYSTNIYIYVSLEHFLCSIAIVVSHEERARTGRQYSEKLLLKAVVVADPTCRSQSRGPEGAVVYGYETRG